MAVKNAAKSNKLPAPAKGVRPRTEGVPGELVTSVKGLGLVFGNHSRVSPYDPLLDQLVMATDVAVSNGHERPALKFGDMRARGALYGRAKRKGLKLLFAEAGGTLYVQLAGHVDDDVKGSRRERIHGVLKVQPGATAIAITKVLRDKGDSTIDAMLTETILGQMVRAGEVVAQDGGGWRLNPNWKGRPAA